jgi:hypothetical protein
MAVEAEGFMAAAVAAVQQIGAVQSALSVAMDHLVAAVAVVVVHQIMVLLEDLAVTEQRIYLQDGHNV